MSIQLLALDLDGTLLNSRGKLTERTREALAESQRVGVKAVLVTGRRFRDARPWALELGLDVPVIAHNGALTKHARDLKTVASVPLPVSAARAALEIGRMMQVDMLLSDDPDGEGVMVYDHLSGDNQALLKYVAWARHVHGDEGSGVLEVDSLEDYLDHDPVNVAFSGSCQTMIDLEQVMLRQLGDTVKIFRTSYPLKNFALLDLVHPDASKGAGVAAAARELGIEREHVLAIGDNFNDLEMLRFAGVGIVMANAQKELRELPDFFITRSNDEDGVALAIEKFVLDR